MKYLIAILILWATPTWGQSLLIGFSVGSGSGGTQVGPMVALEAPFGKRFEIDAEEGFYPATSHSGLGSGWSNKIKAGGIWWVTPVFGLTGAAERSSYSVTRAAKAADYAFAGAVFRQEVAGAPTRIYLNAIKQFDNGVSSNGTETSHLAGAGVNWVIQITCRAWGCVRISEGFDIEHILEQGNQFCDGSIGPQTCGQRKGAISGDVTFSLQFEFGRSKF